MKNMVSLKWAVMSKKLRNQIDFPPLAAIQYSIHAVRVTEKKHQFHCLKIASPLIKKLPKL